MEDCVFISQLGFISEHVSWLCFTEKRALLHVFTEKRALLPVFTEKRALFQHNLRDAKSTKCELKEHLWERARWGRGLTNFVSENIDTCTWPLEQGHPCDFCMYYVNIFYIPRRREEWVWSH